MKPCDPFHAALARLPLLLAAALLAAAGCTSVQPPPPRTALVAPKIGLVQPGGDSGDLQVLAHRVAGEFLTGPFLSRSEPNPLFVIMGVQNRTGHPVDTRVLTATLRDALSASGRMQWIDDAQRNALLQAQGERLSRCTRQTRVSLARRLGARYMLSGDLLEARKPPSRLASTAAQEELTYQLTMEITDLRSGLVSWVTQVERARTFSSAKK